MFILINSHQGTKTRRNHNLKTIVSGFVIIALTVIGWSDAVGQTYYTLSFDRHQSEVFGASNLITAHKALYTFQDRYVPDTLFKENRFFKKAGGFVYRMARFWLLDAQIDYLTILTQHEVFGHGARYREMGHTENSFHLNLFFPYGDGSGYARSGPLKPGAAYPLLFERIAMVFAGNEANQVFSDRMEANMLLAGDIHYRQASVFLASRNNLPAYIWRTRLLSGGGGTFASDDIETYIMYINSMYTEYGMSRRVSVKSLSNESLIAMLDPLQAYSAYTILVSYGVKGHKKLGRLPMIPLGPVKYLPSFNYTLMPFGSQFHWVNFFKWKQRLFTAKLSYGLGALKPTYGIQIAAYHLLQKPWLEIDAQGEYWSQQTFMLRRSDNITPGILRGGAATVSFYAHPLKNMTNIGLYLQAGYKTKGYMLSLIHI
jgi:hypothetical protein